METNIYIKAMEIGFAETEGIKYIDLKKRIEAEFHCKIEGGKEIAFFNWLIESFDTRYRKKFKAHPIYEDTLKNIEKQYKDPTTVPENVPYHIYSKQVFYLRGSVIKQYLDYLELKESRKQARSAQKASTLAIGIAILTLIISIYFSATTPKPPFDVNVLEKPKPVKEIISLYPEHVVYPDNERDGATIINDLKDELNKADELIEYYESDDYKRRIRASIIESNL